ncbi:hypothetical protein [Stackebrandtia soli]|uniref:hypothetical protein n=1 Tax=Stackebrandtia soli TaxID=1892856 RepID=UPI0039EA65E0
MSNNVSADLIRALIENMGGAADDWSSLAMILEFDEGRFYSAHGYAYSPGGTISAVASDAWSVKSAVDAHTASYFSPGEALPVKILVQFDRTLGKYKVTFEDVDMARWKVTPRNFKELREELRPTFD